MTDRGADPEIDDPAAILRSARDRALGLRPGLRLIAITSWSAFIGAVVFFSAYLLALPQLDEPLPFDRLAKIFVIVWALSAIPALSAALLALPPLSAFDPRRR